MASEGEQLSRVQLSSVETKCGQFLLGPKDYSKQYSHLYTLRSQQMRPRLGDLVREKWGAITLAARIIDTEAGGQGEEIALIGVLYKEMSQRASVLDEFKESGGISTTGIVDRSKDNFCSPNDTLVLEDESGRISVGGFMSARAHEFVTGVMVALRGTVDAEQGVFLAREALFCGQSGSNPEVRLPLSEGPVSPSPEGTYILLASGLSIGGGNAKAAVMTQLLMDFLCGRLGSATEHVLASRVARLVICGNRCVRAFPYSFALLFRSSLCPILSSAPFYLSHFLSRSIFSPPPLPPHPAA